MQQLSDSARAGRVRGENARDRRVEQTPSLRWCSLPRAALPLLDPIARTREVHRDLTHRWIVASDHDLIGG
jgi:hypothetical protein